MLYLKLEPPIIVAVCGLAGAGKTTSLEILERLGLGEKIYVGSFVTAEVSRRGLDLTPQNERLVREDLRNSQGMAALAELAMPTVQRVLSAGRVALVDAIYCTDEIDFYRERFSTEVVRLAILTDRRIRLQRLTKRTIRPLDADALENRDSFELSNLGLDSVIQAADYNIENDGSLNELENILAGLIVRLRGNTMPSLLP